MALSSATPTQVRLNELHTARQRHRAVTEWRLLRALRHAHIARLLHVMRGEGEGGSSSTDTLLLVQEFCAGGSLDLYLRTHGAMPEKQASRLIGQLNSALAYCHQRLVFHRGVRASNVLLDAGHRNCKLADFSSAVRTTSNSLTALSTNELFYQAPEVATGRAYQGAAGDAFFHGGVGPVGECSLAQTHGRPERASGSYHYPPRPPCDPKCESAPSRSGLALMWQAMRGVWGWSPTTACLGACRLWRKTT